MLVLRQGRKDLTTEIINRLITSFGQFKAEEDEQIEDDNVFVRTSAFTKLEARQASRTNTVLLGRKGDGKTALLRRLAHDLKVMGAKPNSERTVEVFFQIDMEETYFVELISKFQQLAARIHANHPRIPNDQISKKLWTKFLQLVALQQACSAVSHQNLARQVGVEAAEFDLLAGSVTKELGQVSRPNTADASQGFVGYLARLMRKLNFTDGAIAGDLADGDNERNDPLQVLRDLPEQFAEGAKRVSSAGLHLTLALDRFDDFIDRLVSDDFETTRQLRRQFLHGLISALYHLQKLSEYRWLRVIASLPEDLVVDLDLRELASHRRMLFVEITWSVDDLRTILDNRVGAVISGLTWSDLFTFQVANANKKVQRKEAVSDYLIRHTTRRPRELMAQALGIFERMRDTGKPIDSQALNVVVAASNQSIVETQVIQEWKAVLPGLETFIARLRRHEPRTVFGYADLLQWNYSTLVKDHLPRASAGNDDIKAMLALSFLYRIGMIGFRVRRKTQRTGYLRQGDNDFARYVYSYSPDKAPIADVTSFLESPKLAELVDSDQGKAVRALLTDGQQSKYEVAVCLAPMFFECVDAEHDASFIVDEVT
jgi:hypothetical protein